MRLCRVLLQQHAGEMFVKHWKVQGRRTLKDTGAIKELTKRGVNVIDAAEFIYPEKFVESKAISLKYRLERKELESNEILLFKDSSILLGGLDQAKVLTNTVEPTRGQLPQSFNVKNDKLQDSLDDLVLKCLTSSLLYEAEQKKLPKRKDPERPAWNFPRDYGITDKRKNKLLCLRLLELCSKLSRRLPVIDDGIFTVSLERQGLPIILSLRADALVLSKNPVKLQSFASSDLPLPDITPLLSTISIESGSAIPEQHPLTSGSVFDNIQLAVSHFNVTEVTNVYETEVTEDQFLGRSLLKAFTFASAHAKYLYGSDVVELPKPVVVPCLHTDSHRYHFSIIQVNNLQEDGIPRNLYWSLPVMHLYSQCNYSDGVPLVQDYNPQVFRMLLAFYSL